MYVYNACERTLQSKKWLRRGVSLFLWRCPYTQRIEGMIINWTIKIVTFIHRWEEMEINWHVRHALRVWPWATTIPQWRSHSNLLHLSVAFSQMGWVLVLTTGHVRILLAVSKRPSPLVLALHISKFMWSATGGKQQKNTQLYKLINTNDAFSWERNYTCIRWRIIITSSSKCHQQRLGFVNSILVTI